ncbi:hypothetical protein AB0F77_25850 [Streptomyces sp. NPDC026672]|uniref:hypothetical protein n=1 Tax=unclassified Streptomyces TaxID=2593676 RepID=UPI0033C8E043
MYAYHLVYDIPTSDPRQFRVLVAYKNVYGSRFGGNATEPTVLNGAGQLVIPGGSVAADDVITGGQIEFFEETGIDLRQTTVRQQMKCIGAAWSRVIDRQNDAHCVYQQVQDVVFVQNAGNKNIQGRGRLPQDEELHLIEAYDASVVSGLFRFVPQADLETGWRGDQYKRLNARKKRLAEKKSRDPRDWYKAAVRQLTGP